MLFNVADAQIQLGDAAAARAILDFLYSRLSPTLHTAQPGSDFPLLLKGFVAVGDLVRARDLVSSVPPPPASGVGVQTASAVANIYLSGGQWSIARQSLIDLSTRQETFQNARLFRIISGG